MTITEHIDIKQLLAPYINPDKLANATVYNIGNRIGATGYIDFIKPNDFPENCNLMYGVDIYNRNFLTYNYKDEHGKDHVMTLFQRYSDQPYFFVNCCNSLANSYVRTSNFKNNIINEYHKYMFTLIND